VNNIPSDADVFTFRSVRMVGYPSRAASAATTDANGAVARDTPRVRVRPHRLDGDFFLMGAVPSA
jgi:hypothetical protein